MESKPERTKDAEFERRPRAEGGLDPIRPPRGAGSRLPLALIFGLGVALRLGFWFGYGGTEANLFQPDTGVYWKCGNNLFAKGMFTVSETPPYAPMIFRVPGYATFLGVLHQVFGLTPRWVALFQIVLSLAVLWGVWRLGRRTLGATPALIAALLLAADFATAIYSNVLLGEVPFTALNFVLFLGFFATVERQGGILPVLLCGLGCGLLTLVRPIGLYLFIPLAFYLIVVLRRKRQPWLRVGFLAVVFVAGALLPPGAWLARNYRWTGHIVLATGTSFNLYGYRAAWDVAAQTGRPFNEVFDEFANRTDQMLKDGRSEVEVAEFADREGKRILREHPLLTIRQGVESAFKLMFGIGSAGIDKLWTAPDPQRGVLGNTKDLKANHLLQWAFGGRPPGIILLKGLSLLQILLLYTGLALMLFRLRRLEPATMRLLALCAVVALYYAVLSSGTGADARFRVPFVPMMALPAGLGWAGVLRRRKGF